MSRKFSFLSVAALAALPIPFACGGDDGGTHVVTHDAAMGSAVDAPGSAAPCVVEAELTPMFGSDNQVADEYPEGVDPDLPAHHIYYDGLLNEDESSDDLFIDLVKGYGVYGGSDGDLHTGQVVLTGEETKYSTCGACVYITADWTDNGPTDFYFAQSGVIDITSIATNLVATLTNVTFAQVGYDEDMNWAGDTVTGNCVAHIASASITVPLDVHTGSGSAAAAVGKIHMKMKRSRVLHHRYR